MKLVNNYPMSATHTCQIRKHGLLGRVNPERRMRVLYLVLVSSHKH